MISHKSERLPYDSHVWLFPGAEGGKWLQVFEESLVATEEEEKTDMVVSATGSRAASKTASNSRNHTPDTRTTKKPKTQ